MKKWVCPHLCCTDLYSKHISSCKSNVFFFLVETESQGSILVLTMI